MTKKIIEKMYESFPDKESFDPSQEFDSFLVGDGSAHLIGKSGRNINKSINQLTGIESISDLQEESADLPYQVVDDLEKFDFPIIKIEGSVEDFFYKKKKEYLDKFGFLEVKSKSLRGRPILERDLVVNNDDGYLLHYMEGHGFCSVQTISALAQLSACKDMGFSEVKFSQVDNCPLCIAYDGSVHKVSNLISKLGSGQDLIHGGCSCEFIPVIRNRDQFKDIQDGLTLSAYIDKVYFKRLPLEFVDLITSDLVRRIPYEEVHFIDLGNLKREDLKLVSVGKEDVVIDMGDSLWINQNYVLNYSPFDFLKLWLDSLEVKTVEVNGKSESDQEVLYLNGRRVVSRGSDYVDVKTGEVVSLFEGDES